MAPKKCPKSPRGSAERERLVLAWLHATDRLAALRHDIIAAGAGGVLDAAEVQDALSSLEVVASEMCQARPRLKG